jgi:uncharacterized protein involved in tellurium resistance
VQSAVGTLDFEAAVPPAETDVRLGCLFELRSGPSSTVQRADGNREGPRHSPRPVVVGHREQFEEISVDLRQVGNLARMVAYLYTAGRQPRLFTGTFTVRTFGGAAIEIPLELKSPASMLAVLSLYNVDGELVLRAEMEPIDGAVRDIAKAYGYERITWIDPDTPTE